MKTKLLLIRHGYSEANCQHIFAGHTDSKLTKIGEEQALLTAEYIKENYVVGLKIEATRNLREIFAGEWEGVPFETLWKDYQKEYDCWVNDTGNARCTGGESVLELQERIAKTLTQIAKENAGKTVVIATHATPIRVMQCYWSNLPLDAMKEIPFVSNASVTEVVYEDGSWTLCEIGYDAHLKDLKTVLPDNV